MTWNAHATVGLCQVIFYLPALIAAAFLLFYKHKTGRKVWYALTAFAAVRIVGGIILIVFEQHQESVGYVIAGLILQGTGVVPLIMATMALLHTIKTIDFPENKGFDKNGMALRVTFLSAISLVIAGGVLQGNYKNPEKARLGVKLSKAGYILLVVILVWLVCYNAFLWTRRAALSKDRGMKILAAVAASFPFLAVRIIYSCLTVFASSVRDRTWSPLFGSVAALVVMHSLMEYIVVTIYLVLGYSIPPLRKNTSAQEDQQQPLAKGESV